LAGTALSAARGQQALPLTSVALQGSIDAPLDPDDPGTGGGFSTSSFFKTRLADPGAIGACAARIEEAAAGWARGLNLSRSLRDLSASDLTLHFSRSGLPGFFAVSYRVEARVRARVRVDFYRLDGEAQAPETVQELLGPYRIAALQDALDEAIRCGGKAS
jgi:hypothetical protein